MQLYMALRQSGVPAARREPANDNEPYAVMWGELGIYVMYRGDGPEGHDARWADAESFSDWEVVTQLESLLE